VNAIGQGYRPSATQINSSNNTPQQYFHSAANPLNNATFHNSTNNGRKRYRCPKLLPIEIELLDKYDGCRKCRRFFVGHRVPNCTNDFPSPENYVTLTEDMALQDRNGTMVASTYNPSNQRFRAFTFTSSSNVHAPTPSTSTMSYMLSPATPFTTLPTSNFVEDVHPETVTSNGTNENTAQNSVAAIFPTAATASFTLGNGSSDTESEISTVSPMPVPHYVWHANAYGNDEFPIPIDCLLDNGVHLVLIRPETVE
jgi:hypothetical protein